MARLYGRIDPDDPITSSDVKRAGIKPTHKPLTPSQVETVYQFRAAERAKWQAQPRHPARIDGAFERADVRAGGIRSVWD